MNEELWKCTKQPRIDLQVRKCRWGWLGHTLQKPSDNIVRQALEWNPQGKRGRGRQRNTWWTMVLEEDKIVRKTWMESKLMPRIEWDAGFLWKPYVLQWNDGMLYIYILFATLRVVCYVRSICVIWLQCWQCCGASINQAGVLTALLASHDICQYSDKCGACVNGELELDSP